MAAWNAATTAAASTSARAPRDSPSEPGAATGSGAGPGFAGCPAPGKRRGCASTSIHSAPLIGIASEARWVKGCPRARIASTSRAFHATPKPSAQPGASHQPPGGAALTATNA